jgi:hypothetical protein
MLSADDFKCKVDMGPDGEYFNLSLAFSQLRV